MTQFNRWINVLVAAFAAAIVLSSCLAEPGDARPDDSEHSSAALSAGTGLNGEYYGDTALGPLLLTRIDGTVNFDWGTGSPSSALPVDRFSVRWTGQVEALYTERHTFYTQSDDGIRLWVNGRQIINNWVDHASTENSGTISLVAGQRYDLRLEYYEKGGNAVAKLSWASAHTAKQVVPRAQLYPAATGGAGGTGGATGGASGFGGSPGGGGSAGNGSGSGLRADYYNGTSFDTLALTRTDATVDLTCAYDSPGPGVGSDRFSVRWTGQVQPRTSETYTFYTLSDDGIRVWVNGQLLIDNWASHASVENSGTIALQAGQKYDLKVEYYENGGRAVATLSWSSASQTKQVVPQSQLYPTPIGAPGTGGSPGTGGTPGTGGSPGVGGTPGMGDGTGGGPAVGGTPGMGGGAGGSSGACSASSTIQLIGNTIRDTAGTSIVARGPEMVVAATDHAAWIDTAAGKGANAVRLLLTLDAVNGMTPATFDALVGRAASHKMIVWLSLYTWDTGNNHVIGSALGGGNFYSLAAPSGTGTCSTATPAPCYLAVWSRQWLKDLVAKYQGHVIVDAMQEYIGVANPETEAGRTEWAAAAITNIRWFRAAGFAVPLEVMSNYQGRDLYAIIQKGASIRVADTVVVNGYPQTMFGWQAYWASSWYKSWQGGLLLGGSGTLTGAQAIHQFAVTQQFPIEIGIDNYGGDTGSEYRAEIDQASADGASWLWWSWTGANTVECPVDGATCQSYVLGSSNGFAGAVSSACGL